MMVTLDCGNTRISRLDPGNYFMSGQTNNKQRSSYIALGATRQYTSHSDSLVREMVQL